MPKKTKVVTQDEILFLYDYFSCYCGMLSGVIKSILDTGDERTQCIADIFLDKMIKIVGESSDIEEGVKKLLPDLAQLIRPENVNLVTKAILTKDKLH